MDVDLRACIRGDKGAWDAFVLRWSGLIYAAVGRTIARSSQQVIDEGLVEDVVQDVFVRLIRNDFRLLRTYDPSRASLSTWLTVVARSMALDRMRRRSARTVDAASLEIADRAASNPAGPSSGVDIPLHLLTARQRLVLRLLFDDGRSVEEAACLMDVDAQTVRSTKHKALSRLRARLSAASQEPGG